MSEKNTLLLRGGHHFGSRYDFDFGPCRSGAGWCQVDTWQDASYFGVWTNPWSRQIVTFCEGDVTIELAFSGHDYRVALVEMLAFYSRDEGIRQKAKIDCFVQPKERDAFFELGLGSYLH